MYYVHYGLCIQTVALILPTQLHCAKNNVKTNSICYTGGHFCQSLSKYWAKQTVDHFVVERTLNFRHQTRCELKLFKHWQLLLIL